MADKLNKRRTGLGANAFFQNVGQESDDLQPPRAAQEPDVEEIEQLEMPNPPAATPRRTAKPRPARGKPRRPRVEVEPEEAGRIKVSFGVVDQTVTYLEDLKIHFRRTYRTRTTYGELIDQAIEMLAKREGLE